MEIQCKHCMKSYDIEATAEQIQAWEQGAFIQDVMPNIPAWKRELLISRTCDYCWKKMFPDDDDNYDEYGYYH